ncbi:MAG: hypothetical protein U0791_18295 [Gemmataceae bacterium]
MAAKPKPKPAAKSAAKPVAKPASKPTAKAAAPCIQIARISKQQRSAEIKLLPGPNCKCECKADGRVQHISRTKYTASFRLEAVLPCDETDTPAIFPPGTEMAWNGTLTVRREQCTHDAQPSYFGTNEGEFAIKLPDGEVVFADAYRGTVGVHPSKSAEERCCAHGVMLGNLATKGMGSLKAWTLTASYDLLVFILDRVELCEPNSYAARLNLDGVLIRACPGEDKKPAKKAR